MIVESSYRINMRNAVNVWALIQLVLLIGVSFGVDQTTECACGYGGMCLKNYIDGVQPPCGQLCRTISGGLYDDCSIVVDHCTSSPCLQGARCVSTWGSYFCDCPDEYYGQRCEIHSPDFERLGIKPNEMYVYYQVQPGPDGTNLFHIIYNLRGDFVPSDYYDDDDYEDDDYENAEVDRLAFGEIHLLLEVTLSDGRVFYPFRRKYMHKEIIKSRCFRDVARNPELYDGRICDLLPNGRVSVFSFDATFYEGFYDKKLATRVELEKPPASGMAGTVLVRALLIDRDLKNYTIFSGSYKIFTYTKYRLPHSCERPVKFKGCSQSKTEARLHSRGSALIITHLQDVGYCIGVLPIKGSWYIQENVEHNTYGKYDPVPKMVESTDVPAIFTDDELLVKGRYLKPGLHMFMYAEHLRGSPPYHGSRDEFAVYGRCWVQVIANKPEFTTVGGTVQTVSCYHSLKVDVELKGRPSYRQFDVGEFRINWHCNHTSDYECKPFDLPSHTFTKLLTPCNKTYLFTFNATHKRAFVEPMIFEMIVRFEDIDISMFLDCEFNCYPVDPNFRLLIVAVTIPYARGVAFWEVYNDKDQIVKKDDNLTIFPTSGASRLLRIDGDKFIQKRRYKSDINITATMVKDAIQLQVKDVSHCENVAIIVNTFILVHPQPSVYKYTTYGPIEGSLPFTFTVFSFNYKLKWMGYFTEVRTTKTEELQFTSRGNRVQLCVLDVYYSQNCSSPLSVHENYQRTKIDLERVRISSLRGDVLEFLSDVLTYMLGNVVFESYGTGIRIRWNYTIEDRWELLQVISQARGLTAVSTSLEDKLAALNVIPNYFLSQTGSSYDDLPVFLEDPNVGVDFEISVLWMEIRNRALEVFIDVVGSIAAVSWKYRHDYKLITTPNGNSLNLMARGLALVYHQRIEIVFPKIDVSKAMTTCRWLAGEVAYWDKQNSRSELKLLLNVCNHFSSAAIPFHGLRIVGNDDLRFYAVSSTYFGIVSYFNKSRPNEDTFSGHTDFIFGPYDNSTDSSTSWLRLMKVQLPSVNWTFLSVFSLVVYTAKNLKNDRTISPELYVHLRQRSNDGPLITKLPDGQQIECSLPFMWEGELGHQRTPYEFFTNETIIQPGSRDPDTPWRYMLAFKARLHGTQEEFAFSILQIDPPPPWELQVKLFDGQPSYEDFTPNDSFPQCPGDCTIERDNYTKYIKNGSFSMMEIILRPNSGMKYLPQVFYFGVMLPESVGPGAYTVGIKSVVTECVTEDLATATKENCVSQAIRYNDTGISCKCNQFGRIRILPHVLTRHVIFTDIILALGLGEMVDVLRVVSYVITGDVMLSAILLLVIALIRDCRRKRKETLAIRYTLDSYPAKAGILIVGVISGLNPLAGTCSSVAVKVFGSASSSKVHVLQSDRRKHFDWMGDDWFIIPLESSLGIITHINLWHDFHCSSDWFCARILMLDLNVHQWYLFEINRWFKMYASDAESSMASFTPLVQSLSEVESSSQSLFASYYTRELKNTHIPGSLYHLHPRYIGTYEQQCLKFLVKLFAIIFLTWFVKTCGIFAVDPRLGHTTRLTWSTIFVPTCIAFMSHAFTLPGHIIYRWSVKSWSLQKRTTHRIVHFKHNNLRNGHHILDRDHSHPISEESSDSARSSPGISLSPTSRSPKPSNPSHHEPDDNNHTIPPSQTRRESRWSKLSKRDTVQNIPADQAHRESWANKVARRLSSSRNVLPHVSSTPRIPKATLPLVLFGPCQYWAVNVDVTEARLKLKRVNTIARCTLGGFLALLCMFCLYSELFTAYLHELQQTCLFVVMALLVDAIIIEPLLIFIKVLLAFCIFGITDADLHLWTERGRRHNFVKPRVYSPEDYLDRVTQNRYHPLTSVQLKAKRFEQNMLLATRWSFYYALVSLLAYSSYRQVTWEHHFTTWAYLEATHASFKERFRHHSVPAVGVAEVVDNKTAVQYLVHNYMSNEAYDLFKSGRPISKNNRVWGRDLYSSPTGVTNVIMLQSTNESERPIMKDYFKRFFRASWTNFGRSIPETGPIQVGLEKREFKKSATEWAIKYNSISGRSGESYPFKGQSWNYKMFPWANYYSDFRDDVETLFFKEFKHRLHALIIQANYFCPYIPGLSTVIVVVEKLPNGMTTALIHTQFIQVGDFKDSNSKYPALFFRTLNCILLVIIFWFNVFLMCKLGLETYFTKFQWVVKWLLMCTCCINSYMAAYQYYRRFQTFDHVVDNQEAFVDVYGLTAADSTVLGFLFFLVSVEAVLFLHWCFNMASMRLAFYWCARMVLVGMVYEASRLKLCDFFMFEDGSGLSLLIAVHLKEAKAWIEPTGEFIQRMFLAILLAAAYVCFWYVKSAVVYKVLHVTESPKPAATGFGECGSMLNYVRHHLCKGKPSRGQGETNQPKHSRSRTPAPADQPFDAPSQRSLITESNSSRRHYSIRAALSQKLTLLN